MELQHRGHGLSLLHVESREILSTPTEPATFQAKVSALGELLKNKPVKILKVIACLNDPHAGIKILEMPAMPPKELKDAISFEVKRKFPISKDSFILDSETLGEKSSPGAKKIRVEVAFSPRKTIDEAISLLKKVGIKPTSIIPVPRALQQLVKEAEARPQLVQGVMDIGEKQSELLIFKGKQLVFTRKIQLGGGHFTQSMMGVFASERGKIELNWAEAESMKRRTGLPSTKKTEIIDEKISNIHLHSMLRTPLEQLAGEIERCFQYYQQESNGEKVDCLVLYGRGACLKGLTDFLSEALDLEVALGNPLTAIKLEAQTMVPEEGFAPYAAALGSALSLGKGLNLLPPEIKEESKRAIQRGTLQSVVAAAILTLAFVYTGLQIHSANLDKRIAAAQLELSSLQLNLDEMEKQKSVAVVVAGEPAWEEILKELSNIVPQGMVLTELYLDHVNQKFDLHGVITVKAGEEMLSGFIREMEVGIFKNVKLIQTRESPDKLGSQFELTGWVDTE